MASFYTTFEAARILGVSLPTVVNWIEARRLKAHRTPGGHRRISRQELAAFMVRHGMPVPAELSGAAPARRKVLVVAAAGPPREGTARQLAAAGYAVEQASPGFAAGAASARFEPDALVVHAESEDGGESLREMRRDRDLAGVPVIAVGRAAWDGALRAAGCAVVVAAPPADGAVAAAVDRALAASAPRRRARSAGAGRSRGRAGRSAGARRPRGRAGRSAGARRPRGRARRRPWRD